MLLFLIKHFFSAPQHEVYNGMKKLDADYETLKDFIDPLTPDGYEYSRGNFFSHTSPYYPHVDGFADEMNVLVPLQTSDTNQKFIVFDQTCDDRGTWTTNPNVGEYRINKLRRMRPFDDSTVHGLTNEPCPIAKDLPGEMEFWHGLTGMAHAWKAGVPIRFQSNHIHATGIQRVPKLGLSLIFKQIPPADGAEAGLRNQHL